MAKKQMIRHASDNAYLHKDFHGALNFALIYLEKQYGETAVREYLDDFATKFYSPLNLAIREDGLSPLKTHLEKIYELEGGQVEIKMDADNDILEIHITRCPAVEHIRMSGNDVSPQFHLTHEVVYNSICRNTPYQFELINYDAETGACLQRFSRRTMT